MAKKEHFVSLAPSEYVAIAGVLALFTGLILLMVTRDWVIAAIGAGVAFIVAVMAISMLLLAMVPNSTPEGAREKPGTGND